MRLNRKHHQYGVCLQFGLNENQVIIVTVG